MITLHFLQTFFQHPLSPTDISFTSISTDSRSLQPGALFIALSGTNFDGHDYIAKAIAKGAAALIIQKPYPNATIPTFLVDDTYKALGKIAAAWRAQFSCPIIALTGSCGKTTTKTLIANILAKSGPTLSTQGTLNNHIGVPLTLLQLTHDHHYAVIELGANHPGEIEYLTKITNPTHALITNAGPVHLEGFGSLAGVARAKGEIYANLSPQSVAILNLDDAFAKDWQKIIDKHPTLTFGLTDQAQVSARHIHLNLQGQSEFTLVTAQKEILISLPLLGLHNISNALAAAASAVALGLPLILIKQGLAVSNAVTKRLTLCQAYNGGLIIDDTYNANPAAFKAAIQTLMHFPGKKILVMGDMAELGEDTVFYHEQLGKDAHKAGIEILFATGPLSAHAVKSFGENAFHFENKQQLIQSLKEKLTQDAVILVKGSRSAKMEDIVENLK